MTGNGNNDRIFYAGKYYVALADNSVIPCDSFRDATSLAKGDDVILVAMNREPKKALPKMADKIVIDFDKKLLTISGKDVKLNLVEYSEGTTELEDSELQDWEKLLADIKRNTKEYVIIGEPPLENNEKDITNEMSDMQ